MYENFPKIVNRKNYLEITRFGSNERSKNQSHNDFSWIPIT